MKFTFCVFVAIVAAWLIPSAVAQAPPNVAKDPGPLFKLLDGNRDGALDPYEALDVLRQVESEMEGEPISQKRIATILKEVEEDELEEISQMLAEMDSNNDGKTTLNELDEELRGFAEILDKNKDGVVTASEGREANFEDEMFMSPEDIREEVKGVFNELDQNRDGILTKNEANAEITWSQICEGDFDGNGHVNEAEMVAFIESNNQRAKFNIVGNTAVMSGVICTDTPAKVLRLIHEHPSVRTIRMANVPGSIDDEANLRAAEYIREFGFTTVLKSNGVVASGGTDFFLAGNTRSFEPGARFGIHSWGGPGFQGKDVPRDDPQHQLYLKYYKAMGIPAKFYWRTLEAAPANDIHWMTDKELVEFKFQTANSVSAKSLLQEPGRDSGPEKRSDMNENSNGKEFNEIKSTRIFPVDESFPAKYQAAFDRYVQVIAPSGEPINILAQKEISNGQLRHVRDVMLHYLTNLPGSEFGLQKQNVANRMARNGATMMICRGHDGQFREPGINAQPLYADETIVEGTLAYINCDFEEHRDATLEEILHCVHDNGIGVDVQGAPVGVLPEFQKEIRAATTYAMNNGIWPTTNSENETSSWIEELRDEGSLTQEYLASVIDSYYGLWGPFDEDFGMWGIYIAKTRASIEKKDPRGFAVVAKFFHPFLTYDAEIDASFKGTFSMTLDASKPYTCKSQYLLKAKLTGKLNSNLTGNVQNNRLSGNEGDNVIDGSEGNDTVVFPREESEYKVEKLANGSIRVDGDGVDTLVNVENIVFDGQRMEEQRFVDPVPHGLSQR